MSSRSRVAAIFLLAGMTAGTPAWSQSYQIDCYGSLAAYRSDPSMAGINCTCASARSAPSCTRGSSSRSSGGSSLSAKDQMRATIAGAVVGALLQGIFAEPKGPSPQEIEQKRLAAEAAHQAALARAKEEEARHQKLLGSLSSLPGAKPPGRKSTGSGLRMTALMEPSTTSTTPAGAPSIAPPLSFGDDDEARAWMSNPETLFASVQKPLAVAAPLPAQPPALPACKAGGKDCEIILDPAGTPRIAQIDPVPPPRRPGLRPIDPAEIRRRVALLRPQTCSGRCDDVPTIYQAMVAHQLRLDELQREKMALVINWDKAKETGKAVLEFVVCKAVGESSQVGKLAVYGYEVHGLGESGMQDAFKVAGSLGDPNAGAPVLVSDIERAAPFVDGTPLSVELAFLGQKIRRIWATQQ